MDSLKLIPSVYFDLIARMVSGSAAIFLFLHFLEIPWSQIAGEIIGPQIAHTDSTFLSLCVLFYAAYIVGHLISPFAKLIQRLQEGGLIKVFKKRQIVKVIQGFNMSSHANRSNGSDEGELVNFIKNFEAKKLVDLILRFEEGKRTDLLCENVNKNLAELANLYEEKWRDHYIAKFANILPVKLLGKYLLSSGVKAPDGDYDDLRMNCADAGSQCAKIRAEFMMYNGMAFVVFATAIWEGGSRDWLSSVICLVVSGILMSRGAETRDTFHETVIKFKKASGNRKVCTCGGTSPPTQ